MTTQNIAATMDNFPQELFDAADHHADDTGEPDHAVGDLQDMLSACWGIMTPSQRAFVLQSQKVEGVIEAGARGEFDVDTLLNRLAHQVMYMLQYAQQRGYSIIDLEHGSHWKDNKTGETGSLFEDRNDAIYEAYLEASEEG